MVAGLDKPPTNHTSRRRHTGPAASFCTAGWGCLGGTPSDSATSGTEAAGFWIFEAPDFDVALKLGAKGSKACNRNVEVRPSL